MSEKMTVCFTMLGSASRGVHPYVHPMQVCAMKTKTKTKRLKLIRRRCCHRSDQCSNAPARPARLATSGSGHDHPPQSGLRRPVRLARTPDARGAGAVASGLLMLPACHSRSRQQLGPVLRPPGSYQQAMASISYA